MQISFARNTFSEGLHRHPVYALLPGRAYDVLAVEFSPSRPLGQHVNFRVLDDDNCISWPPIALCVPDDAATSFPSMALAVPEGWLFEIDSHGCGTLIPKELSRACYKGRYFWEDFYNDEPYAKGILSDVMKQYYPLTYQRYRRGGAWE